MTPSEFKAIIPAFDAADEPTIQRWLDRAVKEFSVTRWGAFLSDGIANWVAHMMCIEAVTGATAATAGGSALATEKRVGALAVSYSEAIVELQAKQPFMRTTYGIEFMRLRRLAGMVGMVG
jgi:hypothetical protein